MLITYYALTTETTFYSEDEVLMTTPVDQTLTSSENTPIESYFSALYQLKMSD